MIPTIYRRIRLNSGLWSVARSILYGAAILIAIHSCPSGAEEPPRVTTSAPKDQEIVGQKLGGYYFAPKALKQRHEQLVDQVLTLESQIDAGHISAAEAHKQILPLRADLESVQKQIEEVKTFVAVAQIETDSETTTFVLDKEKTLFIMADKVHLIGWDQPEVKCVLEKTVLSAKGDPAADQLQEIKLSHHTGRAKTEQVGFSAEDIAASEQKFLASPDGKKLDAQQVEAWKKNFEKVFRSGGTFREFQNKDLDIIEIAGLTAQQGNRQLIFEVTSTDGGGRGGSRWQRHANLTVYVPKCRIVGIMGGLSGLQVESVKSPLVVRGGGYRDYECECWVKDHIGPLAIENIPLRSIENVQGPVSIVITADIDNSGSRYENDEEVQSFEPPKPFTCNNVKGDFKARLLRSKLQLSEISGRIDVTNEFGDTTLILREPLAAAAHRIFSQAGHIELQVEQSELDKLPPLLAATECGIVLTSGQLPKFDDLNTTTHIASPPEGGLVCRGFLGLKTKPPAGEDRFSVAIIDRISKVLQDEDRSPGIDLISRGGSVRVISAE